MSSINLWSELVGVVGDIANAARRHPVALTEAAVLGGASQFLVAHALGGYYDGLVKRAERWLRGGDPVAGLGTFQGRVVASREGARDGKQKEEVLHPVVEVVRTQFQGSRDVWRDVHVAVRAEPFHLDLGSDREVEVTPGEPLLSGFEEMSPTERGQREIRSVVYRDEQVWVTGYLEPAAKGLGAYRGAGGPRKLRAPRNGKVWITRQAPAEEWRKLASAHRRGGWAALLGLSVALSLAYSPTLSAWLTFGPDAAPPLPVGVVLAWGAFAVAAVGLWAYGYRKARREWALRFPWL